jgi:hypothetical protein
VFISKCVGEVYGREYNYQRQLLVKEVVKEGTRVADTVYELFDELQPVYSALSAKSKKRS